MANPNELPEVIATDAPESPDTYVEVDADAGTHVEPELLGWAPYQWVGLAMLVLILFMIFGAKVHKLIARGLDGKIAAIKANLDEAKKLRAEAEALREEYAAKIAGAEKDAAAMLDNARVEADAIVKRAEEDTAAVIVRREQMAQDKIGAAERQAVADLRAHAADASTQAAAQLIAEKHGAEADRKLADEVISGL